MTEASNSRSNRTWLRANVAPDVVEVIDELARDRRVTREHIMREAVVLILEEHCLPVPPSLQQQLASAPRGRARTRASTMGDG